MTGPARPAYRLNQWLWTAMDWLYPPLCGGCGSKGDRWCSDCRSKVHFIQPPICKRCGQMLQSGDVCSRCKNSPPNFDALRSWAAFEGPVRNALHQLKYRKNIALGERLAEPLRLLFEAQGWEVGIVAPVPLGIARLKERGYNQAALIARPFSLALGLSYGQKPCKGGAKPTHRWDCLLLRGKKMYLAHSAPGGMLSLARTCF